MTIGAYQNNNDYREGRRRIACGFKGHYSDRYSDPIVLAKVLAKKIKVAIFAYRLFLEI